MRKRVLEFGETCFRDSTRRQNTLAFQRYGIYDLLGLKVFRYDPILGATGHTMSAAPLSGSKASIGDSGGNRDDKGAADCWVRALERRSQQCWSGGGL